MLEMYGIEYDKALHSGLSQYDGLTCRAFGAHIPLFVLPRPYGRGY